MSLLDRIVIPVRLRRPLKWVGYPLFALIVAASSMVGSLPKDQLKSRLETELSYDSWAGKPLGLGMDVTIGDLDLTVLTGPGIRARDIVLRTRPVKADQKPVRHIIDELKVSVGVLGAIFRRPTVRYRATLLEGVIAGRSSIAPKQASHHIEAHDITFTGAPSIRQAVGIPVEGVARLVLDVTAPQKQLAQASGSLELDIEDIVIGDGKAKLAIPGDPFLSAGITFPKLNLGKLSGRVAIEKGRARFESVRVSSPDADATLDGYIDLRDPIGRSEIHAYLKFRPSDALVKREPTIELLNNAMTAGKRLDGYLGFQLTGTLSAFNNPVPAKDPPPGVVSVAAPAAPRPAPPPVPQAATPPPAPPPAPAEPETTGETREVAPPVTVRSRAGTGEEAAAE